MISGLGVICIDMKYLPVYLEPEAALGLISQLACLVMQGIKAGFWPSALMLDSSRLSSTADKTFEFIDRQIVVLTMKEPWTDLVFVIERAALKKTLDLTRAFELESLLQRAS